MRTPLRALALLPLALLGAGCKKGPDLVGKWTSSLGAASLELEFKPDGTFSFGSSNQKVKGEYKLEKDRLTLTTKDVEVPGLSAGLMEKAKAQLAAMPPREATVQFTGDDEVSIAGLGPKGKASAEAITFKRAKG